MYNNKQIISMAKEVSVKLNIPLCAVVLAYKSYFDSIIENISNSDIDENLSLSFNLQYIGKLYTNPSIIKNVNKRKNESIKHKESNTNI